MAIDTLKECVLPVICEEVNECLNFAPLRQIYTACILAKWFKEEFRGRPGYQSIVGTGTPRAFGVHGSPVVIADPSREAKAGFRASQLEKKYQDMSIPVNEEFHAEYMKLFKYGVFDVIRATEGRQGEGRVFRRYFSGSIDFRSL
jgi:hypothetical protein